MADIHVLAGNGLHHWTLVFHFAVPDQDNSVNVNYRTALINSGLGGVSQMTEGTGPGQITTAELTLIQAGELYEFNLSFLAESGATNNAELLTAIRAEYAKHEDPVLAHLRKQLRYYGYTAAKE